MRRAGLMIVMAAGLALTGMAPAQAVYTSSLSGTTAMVTGGDEPFDNLTIGKSGINLTLNGSLDWNDSIAGDQMLPDSAATTVTLDAGGGFDVITIGAPGDVLASTFAISGADGLDFLYVNAGGNGPDSLAVNGNRVDVSATGRITWDDSTEQVAVKTGGGADLVSVLNTPSSPQVLVYGEAGDDTLKLADGTGLGPVYGAFRGGPGTDTVDYSGYTSPVAVDLGRTARFVGNLTGAGTVPPSGSTATGFAAVDFTDLPTGTFDLDLEVGGLTAAQITEAHVHDAGGGTLVSLGAGPSWTNPGFPSTGATGSIDPDITEPALRAGTTYVDVHSSAHPAGDIRGPLTLDPDEGYGGSGTGLPEVYTVENVIGGSADDTFRGSVPANVFACGAGKDSATTGAGDAAPGCETVNGVSTTPNPTAPTAPATPVGSLSPLKPKVIVKGTKVTIDTGATAACPAAATAPCAVVGSATAKIGKKTVKLGTLKAQVATGTSLRLKLKVSAKQLAAWRAAGKLKVSVTVTLTVPGGSPVAGTGRANLKVPPAG